MPQLNQWVVVDVLTHGPLTLKCLKQTKPEADEYQFELLDVTDPILPVTRRFLVGTHTISVPHAPIATQLPYTHWSNFVNFLIDNAVIYEEYGRTLSISMEEMNAVG